MNTVFTDNRGQSQYLEVRELGVLNVVEPRQSDGNFAQHKQYLFVGRLDGRFQFVCLNDRRSFAVLREDIETKFTRIRCLIELVDP